jgi:predicted aldo/keto reductase-like oxidoreductase
MVETVKEAVRIVHEAIDAGVNFLDNAWEYHDGVEDALRYAMSLPVCTTVSGVDSTKVLRQNLKIVRGFSAMSAREQQLYETALREDALDGRFELYKTTAEHEGDVGREQHGFPLQDEVAQ